MPKNGPFLSWPLAKATIHANRAETAIRSELVRAVGRDAADFRRRVAELEDDETRFVIFVAWDDYEAFLRRGSGGGERAYCRGMTLVTSGPHIATYQSVVFRLAAAERSFTLDDGVAFEAAAEDVSAWDGGSFSLADAN